MDATTESRLRLQLRSESEGWAKMGRAAPRVMLETMLHAGVDCIAQPLPARFRRRAYGQCFANAIALAKQTRGRLTYCEGYGVRLGHGLRWHHAWVIDAERRVIDPTWDRPEECLYLGVPIDLVTYKSVATGHSASVFDGGRGLRLDFLQLLHPALAEILKETM